METALLDCINGNKNITLENYRHKKPSVLQIMPRQVHSWCPLAVLKTKKMSLISKWSCCSQIDVKISGMHRLMIINRHTKYIKNRRRSCKFHHFWLIWHGMPLHRNWQMNKLRDGIPSCESGEETLFLINAILYSVQLINVVVFWKKMFCTSVLWYIFHFK